MFELRKGLASALHAALGLMLLGLAGCVTDASRRASVPPEWQNPEFSTAPAPATPMPAAPPAPAPTPVLPAPVPPPPAASTNEVAETWVPLYRWCKATGINPPCSLGQTPAPGYALSTSNGVFALRIGMQSGSWNGMEVRLGFAPQMLEGQPVVHRLDLKKTLRPLLCGAALSFSKTNPTIVIDPGHGGDDAGTRSIVGNRCEREFTLDWARRLGAMLKTNGWQVFLTRSNDTHLSLSNRIAFAEEHRADVFLSLHFNSAAPNMREAGLETYCVTPTGMASSVTRGYSDDATLTFPNNAFDAENLLLAACVHRALLQVNGRHDRGVRHARYLSVLRGQNRPAILVEGGYLSNPLEARRIADPTYRQRLAEAVANALNEKTRSRAPKSEAAAAEPVVAAQRAEGSPTGPAVNSTNQLH